MGKKGRKHASRQRRERAQEETLNRARRRKAKERTLKRKREALRVRFEAVVPPLPEHTPEELRAKAIEHWEIHNEKQADPDPDEAFLARIKVNFLRHEMSGYEAELRRKPPAGMSKAEMDKLVRHTVLAAISAKHPDLADECKAQE